MDTTKSVLSSKYTSLGLLVLVIISVCLPLVFVPPDDKVHDENDVKQTKDQLEKAKGHRLWAVVLTSFLVVLPLGLKALVDLSK